MGKSSAPAAPDYGAIAASDSTAAGDQFALGEYQLQQTQTEFNQTWPDTDAYLQQQIASSAQQTSEAQQAQQYYDQTYQPIQTQLASEEANYGSPGQAQSFAGQAEADVSNAFDQQRAASQQQLESYGIDPSQTRYQALDLGTRISQAAAGSAAGTQSYVNTYNQGLNLQSAAVATGMGYPSIVNADYGSAGTAGAQGINAANQTGSAETQGLLASGQLNNEGVSANSGEVNALNTGYQNELSGQEFSAQQSESFSSGIGSLIGTVAAAGAIAV